GTRPAPLPRAVPRVDRIPAARRRRLRPGSRRHPTGGRTAEIALALLIDTSLLVAFERNDAAIESLGDEERAISVVSVSELLRGTHEISSVCLVYACWLQLADP